MNTPSPNYRYFPSSQLAFVDSFFEIEVQATQREIFDLIIPDGTPGLMFIEEGEFSRWDDQTETILSAGSAYLFGQKTRAVKYAFQGSPLRAFGAKLKPASVYSSFGISADEIIDSVLDFKDVVGATDQYAKIVKEGSTGEPYRSQIKVTCQMDNPKRNHLILLDQLLAEIHANRGNISIKDLALKYAKGYKFIERLFKLHIGVTPKLYSRIIRFNHCITAGKTYSYPKLTDLAYQGGYFDQNHFIKEVKRFTGKIPSQLFKKDKPILEPKHLDYIKQRSY